MKCAPVQPLSALSPEPSSAVADVRGASRRGGDRRWLLALAGLALLHLTQPALWGQPPPGLWHAPAGLGLLLAAWLGPRGVAVFLLDGLLTLLQSWLIGGTGNRAWLAALGDVGLSAAEVWLGWWCYHRLAGGSRRLIDPRSATLFLLLVPGLIAGLFAAVRCLPLLPSGPGAFGHGVAAFWTSHALSIIALVPPLLAVATPWLVRQRLADADLNRSDAAQELPVRHLDSWDWLEVGGLALAIGILDLLLALAQARGQTPGWQMGVIPLLLLVWASIRQGMGGGTVAAGLGIVLALVVASWLSARDVALTPLQGTLLAQGSTALLVGVSFGWIEASEARYRQIVNHVPMVLYSARLYEPIDSPLGLEAAEVETTFVSPASEQVFGHNPEQLLGGYDLWLRRVHPEDRELVIAALAQVCRHKQIVTCEYRLNPGLGSREAVSAERAYVRDTLVPTLGRDGKLHGWEGVAADITEQRQLADSLRRTTGLFNALVANLPAGVFFVRAPSGAPILVNARARSLLGQREHLAAGLEHWPEVYRLHRPDGTPYPAEELPVTRALRHGITCSCDDIIVHRPDGGQLRLVAWAAPVDLGSHGRPDAAVWVFEDSAALNPDRVDSGQWTVDGEKALPMHS